MYLLNRVSIFDIGQNTSSLHFADNFLLVQLVTESDAQLDCWSVLESLECSIDHLFHRLQLHFRIIGLFG